MSKNTRLSKQIEFIVELDKLKNIVRETKLMFSDRRENDAEHSWHLAIMVMVLQEYANTEPGVELDIKKVLEYVLIHDVVEIDAGDVFSYANHDPDEKHRKECLAADRIFAILPSDQAVYFRKLWDDYESQATIEAQFARALDRLQPFLHNYYTDGYTWKKYDITVDQVRDHAFRDLKPGSEVLWNFINELLDNAVNTGMLLPEQEATA